MRRNNLFAKFIITLSLVAFLTMSVGKVQRTYALATTAAIVGEVLLGLGVTYIAYQTLTGANVYVPDLSGDYSYISDLGRTFSLSESGNALFQDLYNALLADPTYSVMDFTSDRLQDIYNDHKSIEGLQSDSSFDFTRDVSLTPINGFDYSLSIYHVLPYVHAYGSLIALDNYVPFSGPRVLQPSSSDRTFVDYMQPLTPSYSFTNYRNYMVGDLYSIQGLYNGVWYNITKFQVGGEDSFFGRVYPTLYNSDYVYEKASYNSDGTYVVSNSPYPLLPDYAIYDSSTDEYLPLVPVDDSGNQLTPQYPQNDNNDGSKYPLVPFVEIPSDLKWGFNWRDALTDLINGGSRLITSAWLADLINAFKTSLSGSGDDINYNFYNEGDTYYFTYYSDVVNDVYNPVYNINIEGQGDVIPVDLNTIEQYTDNEYLDVVKERVDAFSDTVGSFVAFWHNTDYEIIYAVFGSALIVLLGAFIGKWGHS